MIDPVTGTLIATGVSSAANFLAARRTEKFQERMSSTAHQREVKDLQAAGLNPMLSAMKGSGASTPGGATPQVENPAGAITAARVAKAQLGLIDAQTAREEASAWYSRVLASDLLTQGSSGRYEKVRSDAELAALSVKEKEQMIPIALERARAEVMATVSTARAAQARAMLDELAQKGAINEAEWQSRVGEMGPAMRALMQLLQSVRRR